MTPPRPMRLVIGLLAVAGVGKLALSTASVLEAGSFSATSTGPSFFVGAAVAASDTGDAPSDGTATLPEGCVPSAASGTPDEMLAAISQERTLLDEQRANLARRAAEIELANEALAIETARLGELKQEVESLLERASAAHVADIDRLVSLYANMKPRDAAVIMNDMDLEVTITVLGTMPERSAAPILAALNPVRARALSLILLERAKLPGDRRLDRIRLD
jgi:flagellar motility protein MotE (MotC chaperone)